MYVKRVILLIIFMLSITTICAFSLSNLLNSDDEVSKSNKYLTTNEEAEIYSWQWGGRERTYLWCSFPRIDTGNKINLGQSRYIGDELGNWNSNPQGMSIIYLNMMLAVAEYERSFGGWMWIPEGLRISSKKGYKIRKHYGESCHLLKKGNLYPPNALVEIKGGGESWIGYFLEKN